MEFRSTSIPGCVEFAPVIHSDKRGRFIKTYHEKIFSEKDLNTIWKEEYFTESWENVLRGLHFQLPPHDHFKMVSCVEGKVLDAIVDLREGSPTYNTFLTKTLDSEKCNGLIIPPGLAHGFYCLSSKALMHYKVSTVYSPVYDSGILWSSAGIPWPNSAPLLSDRDRTFPLMKDFRTPFRYDKNENR